ncbi:rRNA (guanine-N1)-methyltransferase [Thermobispora bispora]|uniref:Methyltransferase type 11 n=1 Tax=Thermobispora bispora (strain ATCC 19993 / DSM 43833 / CBS 139.67 / JCM 10125 / KCTC 9307 / NBRC 14880 / R51) TaxID=469371 RepID=D6Y2V8_THEBD|nr:methyltransferase domain-containing protein [Thermobispora bispora]ADG86919.1 Methyltransferase type 11 [Thermobispora bispora DSM 43833]MBO2475083.1 methyltransferase domain-containing protein [Actinomycetales bacterium]MDI9580324.1 methyltransferase domain-containing protein [Thermobispora sp.]QSI46905.1 methyltransferase domain-containing protein [Thermobispora bispora]
MLADVIGYLICPVCGSAVALTGGAVRCERGHSFDVARQGYVNMLTGSKPPGTADTPAMVAARAAFLGAGHYAPLAGRLAELCRGAAVVADAGAGTGHYLARALDDRAVGIALDVSKHALKRAARAHPRIGAVVADVWRRLPVRDRCVDVLLNVFAPRNAAEFARVLRPGGTLIVVTPTDGHLRPLVERLGLLSVDEEKERRLEAALGGRFTRTGHEIIELDLALGHDAVEAVVAMGPSAWHTDPETLAGRIRGLPGTVRVAASFRVTTWRVTELTP